MGFATLLGLLAALLVAAPARTELDIRVLSSRADSVTAGDALVRVELPRGERDARVRLDGRDVTGAFRASDGGLTGLVTGWRR
jgi:hypothetical protein